MQPTILAGIAMWSVWQPERNLFFNSFFIETPEGNVDDDTLPIEPKDVQEIEERGGLTWIAITNRDHERDARALAQRFGAKIAASELDAPLLSGPIDRRLADGDTIAGGQVVTFEGLKTPGEFGLHFAQHKAALVGDALWGNPAGALRFMPDEKLGDPVRAVLSMRKLAALKFEHMLVGDGACIFGGARKVLWDMLIGREDAYVNKINRDEAVWKNWTGPAPYDLETSFEVGDFIGADKLGYRLTILPPGKASCPLHWHTAEEELFVIMSGAATLVTPRGRVPLRAGDYVAFPARPEGAHKLLNETNEPCEILMIANFAGNTDVCSYPDSAKVLIEARDIMLRDRPVLQYFDGE